MPRLLRSKLTLVVSLALLVFFGISLARILKKNREVSREVGRLSAEVAEVETRNEELSQLIEYFSKPEHLEKEARLRLNLKRPDERVIIIPSEAPPAPAATGVAPASRSASIVERVKDFFWWLR